MVKAEGVYYWNHKGGRLIDGSAGLFCSAAGHGRKEIAEAVYKSMLELDYTPPISSSPIPPPSSSPARSRR
jgi:Adenosylmethionine-8-amino-7-oxononanoate aminotransferase